MELVTNGGIQVNVYSVSQQNAKATEDTGSHITLYTAHFLQGLFHNGKSQAQAKE